MSIIEKINNYLTKFQGVPLSQKIFFIEHLGVMVKAGISLSQALKTLAQQSTNKRFQRALLEIQQGIEKGGSLGENLAKYPKIFNELFINMIKAGETSGKLEEVLKNLFIQMKKDHELISKVKGALTYPVIVVVAMIGIGIGMIVFVIPKITAIFEEVNATLPLATRILIGTSDFVINHGIVVGVGSVIFIAAFFKIISTKKGKYAFHAILLKLPVFANIIKKINLARFARTLSSLLKTDIPIAQTLQITGGVVGNVLYKEIITDASARIKKGITLEEVLKDKSALFPPVVTQMISVGEKTGSLDNVLGELANFYEEEIDQIMENLPSIIEPILILVLGVGVAAMAIAIIMPMYSLTQQV